ncbi:menaquinone biosynthesis decarboxylase [Thermosediminibacter oceani]|uniref:3-octaprenyl-4hydroxybenzoate decarboxylase n=1 Tax=Thermosediminibacter oceani (strain ATCC BAA-1034 / DSM 16646 / JW/IW-1228P) TaxID=555079 RepID=D9RXN0_THEOJ|nr:menaquinone biosynthesis decarboxylase [Thermosediminibacter oceani]ADL08104.1 3-octaprenyl-4hydroxybenzoate decarboxylase [Thermosediminibacter oceani DSM 16646]
MYKDLQDFVRVLEQKSLLKRIKVEVDSELEVTEIVDRVVKSGGPALLFENVKGSEFPLLVNAFGTYERMNLALEVESLDDVAKEIEDLIDISNYIGLFNKIRSATRLAKIAKIFPKKVKQGACQEIVEEPDLSRLPILKCWPGDGGKFITLPLVITKDPETGTQNMGMYRLQVYDEKTTGIHWHLHKDGSEIYEKYKKLGKKMPVSVALGCDPATIYASTAPLPKEIDEMIFAGFLRKAPLELVKCKTNDIYVPANAEFILEGYVDIDELREEGPFGDHTGYYSIKDLYPVFHLTCMTRKKNPIYPATVVGKPPMEDCFLGKATERIFLPLLKIQCPEIVDINFPLEGVFHNCVIVSIKKRYPGHAKKVMHALWGMGQMMYTKLIIVVDEHVDPKDLSTVAWKVFNNIDARRDVVIVDGPLDALDHASPLKHYGSKMGIDATKKWKEEGYEREWPDDIVMDPKIKELVDRRWKEYGF